MRGLVSAVSTRPHPASPARGSRGSGSGPGSAGARARAESCGSLSGHFTDWPAGGLCPNGVASWTSPREAAAVFGKVTIFRNGLSSLLRMMLSEDCWFGCVLFLSLFFFGSNSPPSLLLSVRKLCSQLLPLYGVNVVFS